MGTQWMGGLELTAPFTITTPSLHIHVAEKDFAGALSEALAQGGLREVDEGGRVTFWPANASALVFAADREGIPVASSRRVYADLIGFGARGLDAAAHIN